MDARLQRIETQIDGLTDKVSSARQDIAGIKANIPHLATKAWILGGAVAVLLTIIGGFLMVAQQYLAPILSIAS